MAGELRDAYRIKATHAVHGVYTLRNGALHVDVSLEELATHTMTPLVADGDALTAASALAKAIDEKAGTFSSSNPQAISAWASGDYSMAVELDPGFGAAWLNWAESLTAQEALPVVDRALARSDLRSEADHARLRLLGATLHGDNAGRAKALGDLVLLLPGDAAIVESAAEAEFNARHFAESAKLYGEAALMNPDEPNLINLQGYAYGIDGKLEEARKTFAEYGTKPDSLANSLDSLGEVYFINGRFEDAEKRFQEAYTKSPNGSGVGSLSKAAYARFLRGDVAGADELQKQAMEVRRRAGDALAPVREAMWLYSTGRVGRAVESLKGVSDAARPLAARLAAAWQTLQVPATDVTQLRATYEKAPPLRDSLVRALYAEALLRANRKDEARQIAALWPLPEQAGDPLIESAMFAKFLAVRAALRAN